MKYEWTSRPLGELVDFASGGTPSKHKGEYWIGDIPWISAKTLKSEWIVCFYTTFSGEHGYVIPPQNNVSDPWPVDWWLHKEHQLVECFFQKLK